MTATPSQEIIASSWTLQVPEGHYATEPDITIAADGTLWLVWTGRTPYTEGGHEAIYAMPVGAANAPDGWQSSVVSELPRTLSSPESIATTAVVASGQADGVAVWVEWRSGQETAPAAALMMCRLDVSVETRQVLRKIRGIRHPATAFDADGALWVTYACADQEGCRIEVLRSHPDGTLSTVHSVASSPKDLMLRPTLVWAHGGMVLAWEAYTQGAIRLCGAHVTYGADEQWNQRTFEPWSDAASFCQAPALSASADGTVWLAWNTDSRVGQQPDLARSVRLARVDLGTGALMIPKHHPLGVDLEASGEDQSLEFPAVAAMAGGGVWVVARASHNFRLLSLSGDGWDAPVELGPVLWGCRGTRIRVLPLGPGRGVVACHDRRGITLRALHGAETAEVVGLEPAPAVSEVVFDHVSQERPAWNVGAAEHQAYWGDIHFHSACSDGVGTIGEAYVRCRDRYGYDFACLTDHDGFIGRRVTDGMWRNMVDIAEHFDQADDAFSTLIGIEYTGPRYPGPGHKCVYFDGPEAPLVCRRDGLEPPEALLARVKELGGIAIPHHVGWLGGDPENHTPEVQPCWEICSTHGQYEAEMDEVDTPPIGHRLGLEQHQEVLSGHFMRRQLEAGQIFGFVGGSDGHGLLWHHGISRKRDSHRTGLTGVWLQTPGRASVMDAIRSRRTWATSGARMGLAFLVDGQPMGSIITDGPASDVSVDVRCWSDAPLSELVLIGSTSEGARVVHRFDAAIGQTVWNGQASVPWAKLSGAGSFLYVRAVREDNEVAWGSPVFWRAVV